MYGWLRVENTPPVGVERLVAFVRRQQAEKVIVQIRVEAPQAADECPFQLIASAEKSRTQHDAADPRGVRLRISKGQCRAPRSADDQHRSMPSVSRMTSMSAIRCGSVLASRDPLGRLLPAPR